MSANGISVPAAPGRFDGIVRPYSAEDVKRLQGSVKVEHTLARMGAEKLWELLKTEDYVPALGALSGNQVLLLSGSMCTVDGGHLPCHAYLFAPP